jgi:hypothetical protein
VPLSRVPAVALPGHCGCPCGSRATVALAARTRDEIDAAAKALASAGGNALPFTLCVADSTACRSVIPTAAKAMGAWTSLSTTPASSRPARLSMSSRIFGTASSTSTSKGRSSSRRQRKAHGVGRQRRGHAQYCSLTSEASIPTAVPYGFSKAGLLGMTRALAVRMGTAQYPRQRHRTRLCSHPLDGAAFRQRKMADGGDRQNPGRSAKWTISQAQWLTSSQTPPDTLPDNASPSTAAHWLRSKCGAGTLRRLARSHLPSDSAACVTGTWSASNFQHAVIPCVVPQLFATSVRRMAQAGVGIGCLVNLSQTLGEVKPFVADRLAWSPARRMAAAPIAHWSHPFSVMRAFCRVE